MLFFLWDAELELAYRELNILYTMEVGFSLQPSSDILQGSAFPEAILFHGLHLRENGRCQDSIPNAIGLWQAELQVFG